MAPRLPPQMQPQRGAPSLLVNRLSQTVASNAPLLFADMRPGSRVPLEPGSLSWSRLWVGLYAYPSTYKYEWLELCPPGQPGCSASVAVYGVYGTPRSSPGDALQSISAGGCTVGDATVLWAVGASTGCTVFLNSSHTQGGSPAYAYCYCGGAPWPVSGGGPHSVVPHGCGGRSHLARTAACALVGGRLSERHRACWPNLTGQGLPIVYADVTPVTELFVKECANGLSDGPNGCLQRAARLSEHLRGHGHGLCYDGGQRLHGWS
jgi:hypothetical protein